jgi:hypothetical protein
LSTDGDHRSAEVAARQRQEWPGRRIEQHTVSDVVEAGIDIGIHRPEEVRDRLGPEIALMRWS